MSDGLGSSARPTALARLAVRGISKSYGATRANDDIGFDVRPGEILGLLGGNGAGKSTLIRIISGVTAADEGKILLDEAPVGPHWSAATARKRGIRIVHQELSLCTNLTVCENFFLENPGQARFPLGIARQMAPLVHEALERIFPGHGINPFALVGRLDIAERQMVEIARVANDPALSLLILDEPSSSLDSRRAAQLAAFLKDLAAKGVPSIYISHKLDEVISLVTRIVVLRNGRLCWQGQSGETDMDRLIAQMGGGPSAARCFHEAAAGGQEVLHRLAADDPLNGTGAEIALCRGEVVGLAGLERQGQSEALRTRFFDPRRATFVSGDRKTDGILPEATVLDNAALSRIAVAGLFAPARDDRDTVLRWFDRLGLGRDRADHRITTLSGGNQQKALMIRALAVDRPVLLLDDPTRGVDIGVKQDFYGIIRDIAAEGRLVLWSSSEDAEFQYCDRILVFRNRRIVRVLTRDQALPAALTEVAFAAQPAADAPAAQGRPFGARVFDWIAPVSLVLVLAICAWLNPRVLSYAGIDLIMAGAVPLVFAALAQMFVVAGSQIDLGLGAFMALASVITATLLVDMPAAGILALAALLTAYMGLSLIIALADVPSIIATLGFSFVWLGTGYLVQDVPGGSSPSWLSTLLWYPLPLMPVSVALIVLASLAALVLNRSGLGVVLRGFGNNPIALEQAGWSPVRAQLARYGLAGLFGIAGGMMLTGIYTASDINAGNALTLLSVAALVMGGCALVGGTVAAIGTACAAVVLTLISFLLGQMNIGADFSPMVQGGLLLLVLVIRSVVGKI
ncbi:ATP-binding cassette domain-containing protein [Paracoccus thiocyanatus]|uniref:ATP-binding cassette domain-containing protein n=1 Tax=Paracoccus thiocyanatus TaxID=34006 RepID=UPI0015F28472|nr:ATP-binding cassette domain-containing protein [Paracoccus thiocyanatus]